MKLIIVAIGSQLLFTISDLLARRNMPEERWGLSIFLNGWFVVYMGVRTFATLGQLYVFSTTALGKTAALFGAMSIILSNALGVLLLNEVLEIRAYAGVALAALAFIVLAIF